MPLVGEYKLLRGRLRAAMDGGIAVEPGELEAVSHVTEERQLAVGRLIDALGLTPEQVKGLKEAVPPTRSRHLGVYPRAWRDRNRGEKQAGSADKPAEGGGG
jgi:hypothetical protein